MELSKKINKLTGAKKKFMKNVLETSSPVQLVVLLYEGALQWLHMAKEEIAVNKEAKVINWSDYANYMGMSLEIIDYLQDSLDMEVSKDFSARMFDLYSYMKARLLKANVSKDQAIIDEVITLMKDIKDAWKTASAQSI
ncbi:MAG: flagellar export chaperone FliS [Candidatus Melainabacteria bacterium]|nr:flagellar export chaperone FliS [Candidatus Melainabacteria bacterium]